MWFDKQSLVFLWNYKLALWIAYVKYAFALNFITDKDSGWTNCIVFVGCFEMMFFAIKFS